MDDYVSLRLPRRFVNEMIEGLVEHIGMLKSTVDYLEFGITPDDGMIADIYDEHDAVAQAEYYQAILVCIRAQL